jgi:hypothetical protein
MGKNTGSEDAGIDRKSHMGYDQNRVVGIAATWGHRRCADWALVRGGLDQG